MKVYEVFNENLIKFFILILKTVFSFNLLLLIPIIISIIFPSTYVTVIFHYTFAILNITRRNIFLIFL